MISQCCAVEIDELGRVLSVPTCAKVAEVAEVAEGVGGEEITLQKSLVDACPMVRI